MARVHFLPVAPSMQQSAVHIFEIIDYAFVAPVAIPFMCRNLFRRFDQSYRPNLRLVSKDEEWAEC
jgi:hypothetical protein